MSEALTLTLFLGTPSEILPLVEATPKVNEENKRRKNKGQYMAFSGALVRVSGVNVAQDKHPCGTPYSHYLISKQELRTTTLVGQAGEGKQPRETEGDRGNDLPNITE